MAKLGYLSKEQLMDSFSNGSITKAEFIMSMSSDMRGRYRQFCSNKGYDTSSKSAADKFMDLLLEEEQRRMEVPVYAYAADNTENNNGSTDKNNTTEETYAARIFREWNNDPDKIQAMLNSNSYEAAMVTKWRYLHPTNNNDEQCALETTMELTTVRQWWDVIDYILGANDGYPVTPKDYNQTTILSIIRKCVPRNLR